MRLKFLILLFLSTFLTSCHPPKEYRPLPGIENESVMWAVLPFAINLQHDKKLRLEDAVATYGGNGTYIRKIKLCFISQSIFELREARDLLVDITDSFIEAINNDSTLGPLTSSFPLSSDDIEICIKFESYFGLYVDKLYIHWMLLQDGWSYFYAFDLTNEYNTWDRDCECWHQRIEPFYKSRQIVTIQRAAEEEYKMRHPEPKSTFSDFITDHGNKQNEKSDHVNLSF
ncbi:MAG TPA: hypothetical protein PLC42_05585 [Parachlamydiaceae bacterium]|nr:hypothetical protein [Parachlamydiaceae bacterium]